LDTAQVTDSEVIRFVGCHDMDRSNIQCPVFTEKGDPLCLEEMGADRVDRYRIGSDD